MVTQERENMVTQERENSAFRAPIEKSHSFCYRFDTLL